MFFLLPSLWTDSKGEGSNARSLDSEGYHRVALSGFVSRRGRVRYLQNVHRVRCIPPTSRWFPPSTSISSTITNQTVCICPRGPLGRLAFILKVSPSLNEVDY
jgi:hypothetical protein